MKKNILITGASSEIGLSIARILEQDYNLILIKHEKEIEVSNFFNTPHIYTCDLNNPIDINELLNKLKDIKIDIIINAAAYDQNDKIQDVKTNDFLKSLTVNVIAPFLLIRGIFKEEDSGTIINIASTDGIDTFNEYNITYATSKAALIHLTKQLKLIYKNMNVYALCPNYVNTKSVKMMEPIFLKNELKRINQKELIEVSEISAKVEEIIKDEPKEMIIRME